MSAVDPNNPVIVIPGGGGATLPDDPAAVLLDAGNPSTIVGLDAAGVGTSLTASQSASFVRQTRSVAGASFAASAGLGTATASTLTMTAAVQTSGSWTNQPRLVYAHGGDPWNVQVTATLAALTGGNSNTFVPLAVRNDAGNLLLLAQARGSDGAVSVYDSGGLLATSAVALPVDGTGALRIVLANAIATVYQSEDSGVSWRPIYRGSPGIPSSAPWAYTRVTFNLYQGSAPGGTVTARWSDVSLAVPL